MCGSVLRQDNSEPQPSTGKTQKIHVYLSCHRDMIDNYNVDTY